MNKLIVILVLLVLISRCNKSVSTSETEHLQPSVTTTSSPHGF